MVAAFLVSFPHQEKRISPVKSPESAGSWAPPPADRLAAVKIITTATNRNVFAFIAFSLYEQ
jgi:inactivated superfamily I helicase